MRPRRWGWEHWALVLLLLLAWALRLPPLLDNRFHPDEALYGYWGFLIGRGRDPWLAAEPVFKPPLLPYLVAGSQALFGSFGGNSEFAVRLPGLVAGLLMIPLAAALAQTLYRDRGTGVAAAVGVALSPFAILFSATAFTDPPMVALGLAACVAAARGRPGWAGLLAGLACATKQTGLAWIPLALGVSLIQSPRSKVRGPKSQVQSSRSEVRGLGSESDWLLVVSHCSLFIVHCSLVILLVFAWDMVRVGQGADGFWRTGVTGYGGLRLIWPQELWARLCEWIGLARYFFVSPIVSGGLLVGLPVLVWDQVRGLRSEVRGGQSEVQSQVREPDLGCYMSGLFADLVLVSFVFVYFLLHWLWAFPVWDRYLLPLLPVLAVLLGRVCVRLAQHLQSAWGPRSLAIVQCSLVILLVWPAFNAACSRYPVGGDHGAYDGIDKVAAFLHGLPEGSVVYQHWLGWSYAYYLFDAPVYLAYWPTLAWLARDVQAFGTEGQRYMTFPSWESPARVERALAGVGYELEPTLTTARRDGTPSFTVYHLRTRIPGDQRMNDSGVSADK
ncbi:MAG: glycosyltransferase family 39 protein [Chloroflexota bacterium]|nr:glycosyltransferase family 39 protein [Chloroflexota bacterium]